MSLFNLFDIANSGLRSQRDAMEIATTNIANAMTPGYKAKTPVFAAKGQNHSFSEMMASIANNGEGADSSMASMIIGKGIGHGSEVAQIEEDQTEGMIVHMPNHPLADANGDVELSNVDSMKEMMDMMGSVKQYKMNLTIVELAKKAAQEALQMTKNA